MTISFHDVFVLVLLLINIFYNASELVESNSAGGGNEVNQNEIDDILDSSMKFGVRQVVGGDEQENAKTLSIIEHSVKYMRGLRDDFPEIAEACQNRDELCAFWASRGECEIKRNDYMLENCGPSCLTCKETFRKDTLQEEGNEVKKKENYDDEILNLGEEAILEYCVPQSYEGDEEERLKTVTVIESSVKYMRSLRPDIAKVCLNLNELCAYWASRDECNKNPSFMIKNCGPSCLSCEETIVETIHEDSNDSDSCVDKTLNCRFRASIGDCVTHSNFMRMQCPKSCELCDVFIPVIKILEEVEDYGEAQVILGIEDNLNEVLRFIKSSVRYMKTLHHSYPEDSLKHCRNLNKKCATWASKGECQKNIDYMKKTCGPICQNCGFEQDIANSTIMDLSEIELYGVPQKIEGEHSDKVRTVIKSALELINSSPISKNCRNKDELCSFWAALGECDKNAVYMNENCAPICKTCDLLKEEKFKEVKSV